MKIYMTVDEICGADLWLDYCEATGMHEWARNEGRFTGREEVIIPRSMYLKMQVLIQRKIDEDWL